MAKYSSPFACKARLTGGFPFYNSDGLSGNSHNPHTGEDYTPMIKTEDNWKLYAVTDGMVINNSNDANYGNHLVILTADKKVVLYAHLSGKSPCGVGTVVKRGTYIGTAGATGNVTGRHLHVEIQNSTTWKYGQNLLKPSLYIDFNDCAKPSQDGGKDDFNMPKTWTNGSTIEHVFQTTTDCKGKCRSIGILSPRETCDCYGIVDGCYLVSYTVTGTNAKKVGFVAYPGGIK